MSAVKNRVLFLVPDSTYVKFASQTPASIWERFENQWALKIVPRPSDLATNAGQDNLGNTVISDYSTRGGFASYEFNLQFELYAFYKVLQDLQQVRSTAGSQTQTAMIDFINPDPEDTLPDAGVIRGFTRRFGVITDLELVGSTGFFFTQNFDVTSGEFLKEYRCQGTRFVFQEKGVPTTMTVSSPGGTLSFQPLRNEVDIQYLGGENILDGYSDTFVVIERKRIQLRISATLNDANLLTTLIAIRDAQVTANGEFQVALLTYPVIGTLEGIVREIKSGGGIETRANKTTFAPELTTQGFSFIFTEI